LFALLYIFIIFLSQLIKEKKWESGPKWLEPLQLLGFSWPGFENKSGPKPKKSGPKPFFVRTNINQAQIKVGQTRFRTDKSGPKES
jgi:hypothetical protein